MNLVIYGAQAIALGAYRAIKTLYPKRVVNCFSPMQTRPGSGTILDFRQFEIEKDKNGFDRFWIADDGKGGIKNE